MYKVRMPEGLPAGMWGRMLYDSARAAFEELDIPVRVQALTPTRIVFYDPEQYLFDTDIKAELALWLKENTEPGVAPYLKLIMIGPFG